MNKITLLICFIATPCFAPVNFSGKVTLNGKVTLSAEAPPPVTFEDTFTRADADPMSATSSSGGTWTSGPGGFDNCRILSNNLRGSGGTENGARVSSPTFPDDQSASLVVSGTGNSILNVGPGVRSQSNGSGYFAICDASTTLKIYKVDASAGFSYTLLTPAITISAIADQDVIKLNAVGSNLEVFINGVSQGTRTDSTYTTGQPWIYMYALDPVCALYSATEIQ